MAITENKAIKVYNKNDCVVCAHSHIKSYSFTAADAGIPSMYPLSYAEIDYINSNSTAIRSGMLTFNPTEEEEIYKELGIADWEDILTVDKIEGIILNPTAEGIQRLVDIRQVSVFERVRGCLTWMKNSGGFDISGRIEDVIKRRYEELAKGKLKSDIRINSVTKQANGNKEVDDLKSQLAEMQAQMKAFMDMQLGAAQKTAPKTEDDSAKSDTASAAPKKRGRPPKPKTEDAPPAAPKKRGRPPKAKTEVKK